MCWQRLRLLAVAFLVLFAAACSETARAQVVEAGNRGGVMLSAGGTVSGYTVQYGQRKLLGFSAFINADTNRRFGLWARRRKCSGIRRPMFI